MSLAPREQDPNRLLHEVEAAEYLSLSPRTLQTWRRQGVGPAFIQAGRAVRYRRSALDSWVDAQTVVPPTRPHLHPVEA